jgi:RNA polymerase sigma-70 factor (ECF subfamily)
MSADEREVILLGYFEGLSSTEIAERLGKPVGTVKSRTRSALEKLRGALEEQREP